MVTFQGRPFMRFFPRRNRSFGKSGGTIAAGYLREKLRAALPAPRQCAEISSFRGWSRALHHRVRDTGETGDAGETGCMVARAATHPSAPTAGPQQRRRTPSRRTHGAIKAVLKDQSRFSFSTCRYLDYFSSKGILDSRHYF